MLGKIVFAAMALIVLFPTISFGQQQRPLPPASQILRDITISAPLIQRVENRDNREVRLQVLGRFTVDNPTDYDVSDLKVRCNFVAPSGKNLNTFDITLYSIFFSAAAQP